MLHAVEFTTTDREIVIRLDRNHIDTDALEQVVGYLRTLLTPPAFVEYPPILTASELRRLPKEQRDAIIRAQVALIQEDENID